MVTPETKQKLEQLGESAYGAFLRTFLNEKCEELGNIMATKSWEETLGRQHALKVIRELVSLMDKKNVQQNSKTSYL